MRLHRFHFAAVAALTWRRLAQFVQDLEDGVDAEHAARQFNRDAAQILKDTGWTKAEFRRELSRRPAAAVLPSSYTSSDVRR